MPISAQYLKISQTLILYRIRICFPLVLFLYLIFYFDVEKYGIVLFIVCQQIEHIERADGDQQSARIFIELVVKAMESEEFQIVMQQVLNYTQF